jgi:hypothetical protein
MANKFKVGDMVTFTGVVCGSEFIGYWGDNELSPKEEAGGLAFQIVKARVATIHTHGFYTLEFKDGRQVRTQITLNERDHVIPFVEEDLTPATEGMSFLGKGK